jgi:hypothetical protein
MSNYKTNIFLYNKQNELVTYVDFNIEGELISFYNLSDNILTRFNFYSSIEKNKTYEDIQKAKITFAGDCKIFHMFEDGESYCKVIKKDSYKLESPPVLSRICLTGENQFEGYTINQNLIQEWLKKL